MAKDALLDTMPCSAFTCLVARRTNTSSDPSFALAFRARPRCERQRCVQKLSHDKFATRPRTSSTSPSRTSTPHPHATIEAAHNQRGRNTRCQRAPTALQHTFAKIKQPPRIVGLGVVDYRMRKSGLSRFTRTLAMAVTRTGGLIWAKTRCCKWGNLASEC